ncbi:MAG: hypothetical protein ACRDTG_12240 [Pseudonocardiaceae bacterium]
MQPASPYPPGWLVLGDVRFLTGAFPAASTDIIILVRVSHPLTTEPPNTIVLVWRELGPTHLMARTMDGHHRAVIPCDAGELFDAALPGPALTRAVTTVSNAAGNSAGTPVACVPLFYVTATPTTGAVELHVYSQIRFLADDACFLRITPTPLAAESIDDLSWLTTALELHAHQAQYLNSHECHYRKCFDGQELEYKYTLDPTADIWTLAVDTHRRIHAGHLTGFIPRYHNEFESWDFLNHLFEVTEPESDRGYVSFIPMVNGKYLIKRKWFTRDTFARREQLTTDVDIEGPLDDYLHNMLYLKAQPLPPFRRVRYDINIESTHTGNIFCILYDRCILLDPPNTILCQCELEYIKTRTAFLPRETEVLTDFDHLARWIETLLTDHHLDSHRSTYSKLSFLRDAVAGIPG